MQRHYVFPRKHAPDLQNYYWFNQGFSSEELTKIYNDVAELPFHEATTAGNDKSIRSSSIKWIPQVDRWDWLYTKLLNMAVEANTILWNFELYSAPEMIHYTEYHASAAGHYGWHQDIGPGGLSIRKVSITVQLSDTDDYKGGDLEIWKGGDSADIAPRGRGNVVIFPSYMMHRVTPVTQGVRRSFVLWLGGDHYR